MSTIVTCPNRKTMLRVADDVSSRGVCPQCFAALDNSGAAPVNRVPNLLRDVRRDSNTTTGMLFLLVGMLTGGVVLAFTISSTKRTLELGTETEVGSVWLLAAVLGMLDVLVLVATTWSMFHFSSRNGTPPSSGHIVGSAFGYIVLVIGLAFAVIIFAYASCKDYFSQEFH